MYVYNTCVFNCLLIVVQILNWLQFSYICVYIQSSMLLIWILEFHHKQIIINRNRVRINYDNAVLIAQVKFWISTFFTINPRFKLWNECI